MSVPFSTTRPPLSWRMPMIVSTSSVCPLPSTPAMPSTSPARTTRSTPASSGRPPPSPASSRPDTSSTTRSVTVDSRVSGLGSSLPTIISASCRLETVRGSAVPTLRPRRITVIESAMERTSSSLCEMNRKVKSLARISRTVSNSSSTSCGTSTAVGSSRITVRAPR